MAKPSNKVCISQVKVLRPVSYFSLDILTGQALTPDQTPVTSGHCQRRTEKHLTKQKSPLKLASFFASFFVNSLRTPNTHEANLNCELRTTGKVSTHLLVRVLTKYSKLQREFSVLMETRSFTARLNASFSLCHLRDHT